MSTQDRGVWDARYESSAKGKARSIRRNARRIRMGTTYFGMAETAEQAQTINAYLAHRLAGFKARQARDREAHVAQ